MKNLFLGLAASFVLAQLTACGAGDPCSATSKCSADPAPTAESKTACEAATKDGVKCATEYKALLSCSLANQVCGSDNKTDGAATGAKCTTEVTAYTTCLTPAS